MTTKFQNCNACSWKYSIDPRHSKAWQTHAREHHSNEPFDMLSANLPNTWKKLVRCESCKTIIRDHHSALIQHAQSCINEYAMNGTQFVTYMDLYPSTSYTTPFIHSAIRRNSNAHNIRDDTHHVDSDDEHEFVDALDETELAESRNLSTERNLNSSSSNISSNENTTLRTSERIAASSKIIRYTESEDDCTEEEKDEDYEEEEEVEEDEDEEEETSRIPNHNHIHSPPASNLNISIRPANDSGNPRDNSRGNRSRNSNASRRTRFLPRDQDDNRPNDSLSDLTFTHEPTPEQEEELTNLIADFSDGAFCVQNGHVKDFAILNDTLISNTTHSNDVCIRELSIAAWLLLPGLYTRLQRKRVTKLHELMRSWANHETPHLQIISQAQQAKVRFPRKCMGEPSSKLSHERAQELIKAGRISALMRAVEQEHGPAVIRKSTAEMTDLASPLHPPAHAVDDDFADITVHDVQPIKFSLYELAKAITTIPEVSAPGASGWTNALLKKIYGKEAYSIANRTTANNETPNNEKGISLLLAFYNLFLNKELNKRTYNRLLMSRLILIPKATGGTRPIAIGDSILRLMLRVINTKVAKEVGKKLEPLQVAVGTSGGCEIIAALVDFTLEQGHNSDDTDTHRGVTTIDLPNAFNGVNRRSIALGLQTYCPELLDLFNITYGSQTELRAHTSNGRGQLIGHSAKGCRQGDPLSMLYFAVAIHPALVNIKETLDTAHAHLGYKPRVIAYADDIALCGNGQLIVDNFNTIAAHLAEASGLTPNIRKSAQLGQGANDLILPPSLELLQLNENGGTIVGIPVGSADTQKSLCQEAITEHSKSIDLLVNNRNIGQQIKFAMLKFCVNTKVDYLCRNVNPNLIQESLEIFDSKIDTAISKIVAKQLDDTAKILRGLPVKLAGLGIRRHAGLQSVKDYNSRTTLITNFARQHLPELAVALDIIGALPLTPNPEHADLSVAAINEIYLKEVCAQVIDDTEQGARINAHIRSGALHGPEAYTTSGLFTNYMGGSDQRKSMQDDTFVTALRTRLCMPVCNMDLTCTNTEIHAARNQPDHVNIRTNFMHTVLCQPAKGVSLALKKRHDYVRDALSDLIRDTAFYGQAAPPKEALGSEIHVGTRQNGSNIIADLVWHDGHNTARGHRYIFDVTIVEPCGRDGLGQDNGHAASLAAAAKINLYADIAEAEHTTFIPFALESAGHIGKHAAEFLTQLDERAPGHSARIAQFLSFVSFILAKQTANASIAGVRSSSLLRPAM